MPKIKNVSPVGALDVVLIHRIVDAGEEFDVTDAEAEVLLLQGTNFAPADDVAQAIVDKLKADAPTEPDMNTPQAEPIVPSDNPDAGQADAATEGQND